MDSPTTPPGGQVDPRIIPDDLLDDATASELLLAVQPNLKRAGIYPPGHRRKQDKEPTTFDWRYRRWSAENKAGVDACMTVRPIGDALRASYDDEAMAVRYIVRGPQGGTLARQPRVNKAGLAWLEAQGYSLWLTTLLVDVDNPGHTPWSQMSREVYLAFRELVRAAPMLARAGTYMTRAGWRVVQPLSTPVPIARAEEITYGHMRALDLQGVKPDYACADWTHLFRLPKTQRDGQRVDAEPELEAMEPIDPTPFYGGGSAQRKAKAPRVPRPRAPRPPRADGTGDASPADSPPEDDDEDEPAPAWSDTRVPRRHDPFEFTTTLPARWDVIVDDLARAVRQTVTADWRKMYLALGGAILFRKEPHEYLPEVIRRIAVAAGSVKPADHGEYARGTCQLHADGGNVSGMPSLTRGWPGVARAVDRAFARGAKAEAFHAQQTIVAPSVEEARDDLLVTMVGAAQTEGVTVVATPCGVGKTFAVLQTAQLRANTIEIGKSRASPGTRMALSQDRNELSIQSTDALRAMGVAVERFRSPVSVKDGNVPVCRVAASALALQAGGQSVSWELCEGRRKSPCPYAGGCRAKGISEGDENAYIYIGNHATLGSLMRRIGPTGALFVDEPSPLLQTVVLEPADLRAALAAGHYFYGRYAAAMTPAVQAVVHWMADAPLYEDDGTGVSSIEAAVVRGSDGVGDGELRDAVGRTGVALDDGSRAEYLLAAVRAALLPDHKGIAPPIRQADALRARHDPALARTIGAASKVYRLLYETLCVRQSDRALRTVVRVEERKTADGMRRVLLVTNARREVVEALRRRGPMILSDANAELHLPILKAVLSTPERPFEPRLKIITARDRVPIRRSVAMLPNASRAGWLVGGKPVWGAGLLDAIRRVVHWIASDPEAREVCLITYKIVAVAIRVTLDPTHAHHREEWAAAGGTPEELAAAEGLLRPVLTAWPGRWMVAHYGAIRGLNHAQRCDTYVTLGDPRPPLGEVRNVLAFCGLDSPNALNERVKAETQAELEQAHGRARDVCRTTPCRHLHVGNVLPGGVPWTSPEVEMMDIPPGPIGTVSVLTAEELVEIRERVGDSRVAFAERLDVSPHTLRAYEIGARRIPNAFAQRAIATMAET